MPRAIWSGAVSFGLVNVPVKVVTAVSHERVQFHQLHDEDGVRIQLKRICPQHGEEIPYEHIVKGYPVGPSEYVVITPEEFDQLDAAATHTIDITEFVSIDEIDPIYYDRPYLLTPDTGGAKPYALLARAMREAGLVALAQIVLRRREHLVAVKPYGGGLAMITMNYASEVVQPEQFKGVPSEKAIEIDQRELDMAAQLVEALTAQFEPEKYHDTYNERVMEMIEAKAEGQEFVVQPPREEGAEVISLVDALEQSLRQEQRRAG